MCITCTLCAVKEETKTVCLSASVCAENPGKLGVGPVAVVCLGVGGVVSSWSPGERRTGL